MPTIKLNKGAVDELQAPDPSGRQKLYWDEERRGLGVLCSGVTNTKSWVCQANLNGKAKRVTIGPVNVLDPKQAWERAQPLLADMYAGIDRKAERKRQERANVTVEQVLTAYCNQPRLSPKTTAFYRDVAQRHLSPWLDRPLRSITADDVETRFAAITKDVALRKASGQIKGGVSVTGQSTANQALQLFGSLWNYQSERDESLGRNPTTRLSVNKAWHKLERRSRRLWSEDLPEFYAAVMALPNIIQRDLVLFGLFTGMREGEASGLQWSEVDFRHRMIRLPAIRMKAKKAFELPMSDYIHDLLVARRAIGWDGAYCFPGEGRSGHCVSYGFALEQLSTVTGVKVSPHDLRRTFISIAATCAIPGYVLKLLVAHTVGNDVTAGYISFSPNDLRQAVQTVADRIAELCGITPAKRFAADNVTRLG